MNCPACGNGLQEMTVGDLTVDVCKDGCGGIWFDQLELKKVDEPHESAGAGLLDVPRDPSVAVDNAQRRTCPKCDGVVMMRHFFSVRAKVEVDECPKCGGFWLDQGELASIRAQFGSEEEGKKAAQGYFSQVFGGELAAMAAESDKKTQKARKIAQIFRFICPSYYLPGKQDWGAF